MPGISSFEFVGSCCDGRDFDFPDESLQAAQVGREEETVWYTFTDWVDEIRETSWCFFEQGKGS